MKRLLLACVVTTGLLTCSAGEARALLIDSFDFTPQSVDTHTGTSTPTNDSALTATAEAVGNERDLLVAASGGASGSTSVAAEVIELPFLGGFTFTRGTFATGMFNVTWDGIDGDATSLDIDGLGGVDLTDAGNSNFLAVDSETSVVGGIILTFTIYDMDGDVAMATVSVSDAGRANYGTELNEFVLNNPDIDLDDIGAIVLTGTNNVTIYNIQTLPEPSSIALLGMGAFGLVGYGWRRKRKQVVTESAA